MQTLRTQLLRATDEVDHIQTEWTHANEKLVEVQRRQRAVYKDFAERCRQTSRIQDQLSQLYKQHEQSLLQIESRMTKSMFRPRNRSTIDSI
jgi:regulator of replication initiation timing